MDPRLERQAQNEALMREVNERISQLTGKGGALAADDEVLELHCECGRLGDCRDTVRMTPAEYERVRAQSDRFAVVPGHETPELEWVAERSDRYLVVDKVREAEHLVEDDPRANPTA